MTNDMTIRIVEQPGQLGRLKASQLARLIAGYIQTHPEIDERVRKEKEETT